jgi:U3 small nucleolar RNA-associated protein 25
MDHPNATTTRLLTLLNVSAVKTGKRKRTFDHSVPTSKLNKRKSVLFADILNDVQEPAALNDTASHEDAAAHINAEAEHADLPEENESQSTSNAIRSSPMQCYLNK